MSGAEPIRTRSPFARKWADEGPVPHPAPEVPCRDALPHEISQSPRLMRALAESDGWAVRVTYARGTVLKRTGKPGRVVDSIALRMHKANRYAWAIWHNGRFDDAQIWERGVTVWPTGIGAKELAAWLVKP